MTRTSDVKTRSKPRVHRASQLPEVTPPDNRPDETWSVEQLLAYGRKSLGEADECDRLAAPLARQSIAAKFGAGHCYSILRDRFKPRGEWCRFQATHRLPRTTVWEVVEVYQAATRAGLKEDDLVERFTTWTGVLLAFGVVRPRNNDVGGCTVEYLEPPSDDGDDNAPHDSKDKAGTVTGTSSGREGPDRGPARDAEENPPAPPQLPVTAAEIDALTTFLEAVGGLSRAEYVFRKGIEQMKEMMDEAG
jgi:hypothetical protein